MAAVKSINIKEGIHDLVVVALDEHDWDVEKIVSILANEIKFVVSNYADEVE